MDLVHVVQLILLHWLLTLPCVYHAILSWTWMSVLFFWFSNLNLCFTFVLSLLVLLNPLESTVLNWIISCHVWSGLGWILAWYCFNKFILFDLSVAYLSSNDVVSWTWWFSRMILGHVHKVSLFALLMLFLIFLRPRHLKIVLTWRRGVGFNVIMLNFFKKCFSGGSSLNAFFYPIRLKVSLIFLWKFVYLLALEKNYTWVMDQESFLF